MSEFHEALLRAVAWTETYLQELPTLPITSTVRPGDVRRALPGQGPEKGEPLAAMMEDFEAIIAPALTNWSHPGFFNYFSTSTSEPGIVAELLTAAVNVNGMLWRTSPAVTELEQVTLDWIRQWMGLPDATFGMMHDTASTSTLHALIAARDYVAPETRDEGLRGDLIVYTSSQSHSSVEKDAVAAGFGRRQVRRIAVDETFAMRVDALRDAVAADVAQGLRPCCIVPTIGTTATTAIDPVNAAADIAEACGAWLHVDTAYGGPMAFAPEFRHLFAGIDRADSLVMNPHKWMYVPFDCSVLFTRRPEIFRRAFSLVPSFLQTTEESINFMDYGVPLGRRFRALKLWFVMRALGREGFVGRMREQVSWAQWLAAEARASANFEVVAPVPMALVCLRFNGSDEENASIVDKVNATRRYFLGTARIEGRVVIRVAIGTLRCTRADVEGVWQALQEAAASLLDV